MTARINHNKRAPWSAKALLVAAMVGMAAVPAFSTLAAAEQFIDWTCGSAIDGEITTGVTYTSNGCSGGNVNIFATGSNELLNVKIIINNAALGAQTLTFDQSLKLGKGSSLTLNGGSYANVNINGGFFHPSAAFVLNGISVSSDVQIGIQNGVSFLGGTIDMKKVRASRIVLSPEAEDATININDCDVSTEVSLEGVRTLTRSKIAITGSNTASSSIENLKFSGRQRLVDSEFTVTNSAIGQIQTVQVGSDADKFYGFTNTKVAFVGNAIGQANTDELNTYGGSMTFQKNTFGNSGAITLTAKNTDDKSAGTFILDETNTFIQSRVLTVELSYTSNSVIAAKGPANVFGGIAITDSNGVGTRASFYEVDVTDSGAVASFTLMSTTNAKISVEKVRVNRIRLAGAGGSSDVNTGAEIRIVNNHEVNMFNTANELNLDNSVVTIAGNRFNREVDPSSVAMTTNVWRTARFSRSRFVFENNNVAAFVVGDVNLYAGNAITEADASEFIFRGNTFRQSSKPETALQVITQGGKLVHDATNMYAGASVKLYTYKSNGNVIAFDTTNSYGSIDYAQLDGVNGDVQLRGVTADSINLYLGGTSHSQVIAEALTADSLTLKKMDTVFNPSGPNALAIADFASFVTVYIHNNDNVDKFNMDALNLRDSNVTVFMNRFGASVIGSPVDSTRFTRTRAFFNGNTFASLTVQDLTETRGSELVLRNNRFTETVADQPALIVSMSGLGRVDIDKSNTFAGGDVEITTVKSQGSVVELEGQKLGAASIQMENGESESITVRGVTVDELILSIDGSTNMKVLVDACTIPSGITFEATSDVATTKASIVIQKNTGVSAFSFAPAIFVDSNITVSKNEFTPVSSAPLAAQISEMDSIALKNTPITFVDNRIFGLSVTVTAAKASVLTFLRNTFLETSVDPDDIALLVQLADGGSIIHDASNVYSGGSVTVESTRGADNVFILEGIQHHGEVAFIEYDGANAKVVVRGITADEVIIQTAGSRNTAVEIESVTTTQLSLNGGLGLTTSSASIKVTKSVITFASTTNLNLADSELTIAKNRFTAFNDGTNAFLWTPSSLARTCVTIAENSFQLALNLADASVADGSSLTLRANAFWVSAPEALTLAVKIAKDGHFNHDASNMYAGGSIVITSTGGRGNTFIIESDRVFGAVSYTETAVGKDAYVSVRGLTAASVALDFGVSVNTAALLRSLTVTGPVTATMSKAFGSYIGIEKSTLSGGVTFDGFLRANSHIWVRESTATAGVVFAAKTDCRETEPCRVEIEGNKLSSKAAGSALDIAGSIGDRTTLSVTGNRLGTSATGLGIAFTAPAALTGSASLVVASNAASRFAALQKALYFASPYTFTGSADVWGNAFISGAIRLKLGASPAKFNIVNNRADFFLVTGAQTSGRTSACNTFSGNDKQVDMMGAGFKTVECEASSAVAVCGGSRTQAATKTAFAACAAPISTRTAPTVTATCGLPANQPGAASGAGAGSNGGLAPSQQGSNSLFLQSAGAASVWASFATVAAVGAMMAL